MASWNPLPIDPACKALGSNPWKPPSGPGISTTRYATGVAGTVTYHSDSFQPIIVKPRGSQHQKCWTSIWNSRTRPPVIDLTGGQPDLTPEWVPWILQEVRSRNLENKIYVWSDDNLSTDYFWKYLTNEDIDILREATNYGRVGCFKGFDEETFSFNTHADGSLFYRQFDLFRRFLELGIDIYAYVTLTSPTDENISERIPRFRR